MIDLDEIDAIATGIMRVVRKEMKPIIDRLDELEGQQSEKQKADAARRMPVIADLKQAQRMKTVAEIKAKQNMAKAMAASNARRAAKGLPLPVVKTR